MLTEFKHLPTNRKNMCVAGIDGCKAGWIVVSQRHGILEAEVLKEISPIFEQSWDAVMLDMPIGLPEAGRRDCDREAREKLSSRRSSVFFAPTRSQVAAKVYDEVRVQGVSLQSFYLFPKIREVDRAVSPADQQWLREAHPELAYHVRISEPLEKKRTPAGQIQRMKVLHSLSSPFKLVEFEGRFLRKHVAIDDLLDAAILMEVAHDWVQGRSRRTGGIERDSRGLKMEICF